MSLELKNMYNRRPLPPLSSVPREEVSPEGDLPIGQEVPFVSTYFGDFSDTHSTLRVHASKFNANLEAELGRDGSHIVWVENARSGELLPTRISASGRNEDNNGDEEEAKDSSEEVDENSPLILPKPLEDNYNNDTNKELQSEAVVENIENGDSSGHSYAAMFLRGMFLLFQGMLAGFTFISVSYLVMPNDYFLPTYQASANEVRRICFVLSSLAALGAVDDLMSLISRTTRPSLSGTETSNYGAALIAKENTGAFAFAVLACIAYLATLIFSILLGGTDTLIYYKFGQEESSKDWVNIGMSLYSSRLGTWRRLVTLRIIFACIGWICSCILLWRDLVAKDGRGHELVRLQNVIEQWRQRVNILEGSSLEGLSESVLRRVIALQSLGIDRTSSALRVVENM